MYLIRRVIRVNGYIYIRVSNIVDMRMTQENQLFATEGLTAVWIIKIGKAHSFDKRKQ